MVQCGLLAGFIACSRTLDCSQIIGVAVLWPWLQATVCQSPVEGSDRMWQCATQIPVTTNLLNSVERNVSRTIGTMFSLKRNRKSRPVDMLQVDEVLAEIQARGETKGPSMKEAGGRPTTTPSTSGSRSSSSSHGTHREARSSTPFPDSKKVRGIWCENCNSRLVELKKQAVKQWMPFAMHRDALKYKVSHYSLLNDHDYDGRNYGHITIPIFSDHIQT